MPRLSQKLLLRARSISPLLPLILRETRELPAAINELRWLREHLSQSQKCCSSHRNQHLLNLCLRRQRGEPLQYLLGTQPFGELEIKCKPGVLIPRPETEAYTAHVAKLLNNGLVPGFTTKHIARNSGQEVRAPLKILDICTGTGSIPLLLHSTLSPKFPNLTIRAIDISPLALSLAHQNLQHNIRLGHLPPKASSQISFHQEDFLEPIKSLITHPIFRDQDIDVLISNPPYISTSHFVTQTTRSVRNFEPKLALVPPPKQEHGLQFEGVKREDIFYKQLLELFEALKKCRILLMEVGDGEQAGRVVDMVIGVRRKGKADWRIEVWRDDPEGLDDNGEAEGTAEQLPVLVSGEEIIVKGKGKLRSVAVLRENVDQK